jgi:hypothetical protein
MLSFNAVFLAIAVHRIELGYASLLPTQVILLDGRATNQQPAFVCNGYMRVQLLLSSLRHMLTMFYPSGKIPYIPWWAFQFQAVVLVAKNFVVYKREPLRLFRP